jgi:hypothetical protein
MKNISALLFCLLGLVLAVTMNSNVLYPIRIFASFPIEGLTNWEWGTEYFPLSRELRIILSAVWYGFLLAILASIPFCITKLFKNKTFYQTYKAFWLCGGLVFSSLTAALTGITPTEGSGISVVGIMSFVIWYMTIAYLAILPAYLQYKYYNKP